MSATKRPVSSLPTPDLKTLFESALGLYLGLFPDLGIVAVSKTHATMHKGEELLCLGVFEGFPDNPDDPSATGVRHLRISRRWVLSDKAFDTMAVQRYDIQKHDSEGGGFEERFWSPVNSLTEVVILDLVVPNVSGFDLLEQWRGDPRTADLPIFVLTSKDLGPEQCSYLRTHAESLLHKQPWQEALLPQLQCVVTSPTTESV